MAEKNRLDGCDKGAALRRVEEVLKGLGITDASEEVKKVCITVFMEAEFLVTHIIYRDMKSQCDEKQDRIESKNDLIRALGGQP